MSANSRTATAAQILCVIVHFGGSGTTATAIAKSLRTDPVLVRRLLKPLERAGLVTLKPGRNGGVSLAVKPAAITLDRVYRAMEDGGVLALRTNVNPRCPVGARMKGLLGPVFQAADDAVAATLRRTTLAALAAEIA